MKSEPLPREPTVVKLSSDDDHALKPNVDSKQSRNSATSGHLTSDEATEIALGTIDEEFSIDSDNSPYPEVRANVPNVDDVELPVNTVRMWFLGIVFTMVRHLDIAISGHVANHIYSSDLESISFFQCDTQA